MKSVRRDSAEDRTDAKDYFATKEEVKNALRKLTEQMTEFHTATEERMASLEEKAFFTPQVEEAATTPSAAGQEEDPTRPAGHPRVHPQDPPGHHARSRHRLPPRARDPPVPGNV